MSRIVQADHESKVSMFTKSVMIQVDGASFSATGLCDTGATTRLLVSPKTAAQAQNELRARVINLKTPIKLKDYRNRRAGVITMKMIATFEIDGRRFRDETFLITECGHDIFVGQHWLAEQDVWIHPRTKAFCWPDEKPALAKFSRVIEPAPRCRKDKYTGPQIQEITDRRERAMDKAHKQSQIRRRSWREPDERATPARATVVPESTVEEPDDQLEDGHVVATLMAQVNSDPRRERWAVTPLPSEPIALETNSTSPTVSISALSKDPRWRTNKGEKIPFPIDEDPEHIQLVREELPPQLAHLEGFFSKKASTKLPPHRPGHDVVLELERPCTGAPPTYRTPVQFLPLEKETIDELLKIDFIEPCMQHDAAPVLFVPKPHSNDRRFCTDYRWKNQFLKNRLVPAPDINGTIFNCRGTKRWTKIDIIRAFNRLRMAIGSEYLTAFRTRQGTFQWKVLPFGLKVGPAWWQSFINAQLNELLDDFASAYADDVLIYSEDEEEHWMQVEEIIHRLHRVELQGDIKKSRFNVTKVNYLGIVMEAGVGISIDPEKIEAITSWEFEDLKSTTAVRSFLGLCNYVRMFCHHASGIAEPLNRLLKKDVRFEMGPEQQDAFETLKKLACEAPVVAFFVPGRPTKVETDASRNATGGVIWQQQEDGIWKPVGYFSKTMTPAERAYPIQDRELLAVVQTLEHYTPELIGSKFFVVTDHQALVYFSSKKILSTRQVRWADFLANFDITFQYRPGKDNVAADALSRKTADLPTVKAREREERNMALIPPERIEPCVGATLAEGAPQLEESEVP